MVTALGSCRKKGAMAIKYVSYRNGVNGSVQSESWLRISMEQNMRSSSHPVMVPTGNLSRNRREEPPLN
jgi:hypothetical protein